MSKEDDILNSGTFYWFKANRRGKVAIPLRFLTRDQKETLRKGLLAKRYELFNPYHLFTAHYMWFDDNNPRFYLVTDVKISPEIKRKISPTKPTSEKFSYKITLSDMNRLLNDFQSGVVDEIFIEEFLAKTPWRPWNEREWKIKRDSVIKNSCEKCGSEEKLTLQHTIQPTKINSILYRLVGDRYEDFQIYEKQHNNEIELTYPKEIQKVPVCPKCGSCQVHLRTRGENKGTYVCNKSKNRVVCKHKFVDPNFGYSENDIKEAEKRRMLVLRDKFIRQEGLLKIAAEIALEEIIIYLNFDHTKTLCNKCAYMEDKPFDKYFYP